MSLDNEQVKLALTNDKEVLAAMRSRGTLVKAKKGHEGETLEVMFDSRPIQFRVLTNGERTILPLSGNVARRLVRDSLVLIGDPLTGEYKPALVEVGRYKISEGDPALRFTKTTCPFCRLECRDPRSLASHLSQSCEAPEAGVPRFIKEREEAARKKEAALRAQSEGPTPEQINEVLTDSGRSRIFREVEPEPVPVPDMEGGEG